MSVPNDFCLLSFKEKIEFLDKIIDASPKA